MRQQMLADNGCYLAKKQHFCERWWCVSSPKPPESMTDACKEDPFSAENIESMREMPWVVGLNGRAYVCQTNVRSAFESWCLNVV